VTGPAASPLIDVQGLVKDYQGLRPLRMRALTINAGDVVAVSGLDAIAAETFVHLITGATLPDSGEVSLFGRNTRSITDGDAWLKSLDGVGMITARGILIEAFTVLQNVAMSLTLDVDPIDPRVLPEAGALAREVGLDPAAFDVPTGSVTADLKMRVHLARALALGPKVLVGEHPSATLPRDSVSSFAADLARVTRSRGLGLLALTSDEAFAKALGGERLVLNGATGELTPIGLLKRLFS
jgi:predicted ABC-type transport system involved in lysophospholipase L1 biosynthesis ATPase subunit